MTELPTVDDEYDCRKCGACCATVWQDDRYVSLTPREVEELPEQFKHMLVFDGDKASMRLRPAGGGALACIALSGKHGTSVTCTIYDYRPHPCRVFEPGSDECDYARTAVLGISDK